MENKNRNTDSKNCYISIKYDQNWETEKPKRNTLSWKIC